LRRAAAILWLIAASAGAETRVRIVVPSTDNLQYLAFWVARGAGLFAEEGITTELVVPGSHSESVELMHEGRGDAAVLPPPLYLEAIGARVPLVLVANLLANDPINLVVRPEIAAARGLSRDQPLAERLRRLRGLRVGVAPHPRTRLRALFASVGFDAARDVQMVVLRGRDQNAAFSERRVDALFAHTPYLERALVADGAKLIVHLSGGEVPALAGRQIHTLAVARRLAEERPEVVLSLVRALARALRLVHRDRPAALRALLREFPSRDRRQLEAVLALYEPALPETPLVSTYGLLRAAELFPEGRVAPDLRDIALAEFVNPRFAEKAIEDLASPGRWFYAALATVLGTALLWGAAMWWRTRRMKEAGWGD
jgi:ABC-type nitrate/sulfonate/bicarbonate transport system substrate-binding protein